MLSVLSILFLLVAFSQENPLDGREGSKDWEDLPSWRGVQSWEDRLNWEPPKHSKDQKGWEDEIDLELKGWDSMSDSTFPGSDNHEWKRKRRSLEADENGATVLALTDQHRQSPNRESMETAEVNAIFLPAKFRLRKKAAYQLCRRMWQRYEGVKRQPSHSFSNPFQPQSWTCNEFCCYPSLT